MEESNVFKIKDNDERITEFYSCNNFVKLFFGSFIKFKLNVIFLNRQSFSSTTVELSSEELCWKPDETCINLVLEQSSMLFSPDIIFSLFKTVQLPYAEMPLEIFWQQVLNQLGSRSIINVNFQFLNQKQICFMKIVANC